MTLLFVLRDLLLFGLLFLLPGLLTARWLLPAKEGENDPTEHVVVALAAGFGGVSVLAFTFSLLTLTHLSWIHVALAATAIAWRARRSLKQQGRLVPIRALVSGIEAPARLAVGLTAAVFALFLVNYDRAHFQYGCIHTVVQLALDDTVAIGSGFTDAGTPQERVLQGRRRVDPNPIRGEREVPPAWMNPLVFIGSTGQRYGTTAMIGPAAAIHGFLGFRLVYALHAALLAAFLFLLGRQLTGSAKLAALAAALAVVNPWLLKISLLDENLMSATWAAGALVMATRLRPAPVLAGLFCGLALGIRHIDIGLALGVGALVLAPTILSGSRARDVWRAAGKPLLLGLLWGLLHELVHHQVAYGTLLSHEHFVDEVWFRTPYTFLGHQFEYAGLLNWPFAEHVVRTPYNGFPTFLLVPLSVVAHLGAGLCAVALVGFLRLTRWPALAAALAAWALPILALHVALEDWLDPNKMGILVTLQPVLAIGLVLGLQGIVRRRTALATAVLAVGIALGARAARSIDVPDDPAFYDKYPLVRVEQDVYAAEDRLRWTRGNLLPDWRWMGQHSPIAPVARLRALGHELGDRDLRQGPLSPLHVPPVQADQRLRFDLSRPLVGRRDFLTPGTRSAELEIDVRSEGAAVLVEDLAVPWSELPADLLVVHDPGQRIRLFLRFGLEDFGDFESVQGFTIAAHARDGLRRVRAGGAESLTLLAPLPAVLEVAETVSLDQVLIYRWDGTATDRGVSLSDWRKLFHN